MKKSKRKKKTKKRIKVRKLWDINPKTKVQESAKDYNRKKRKKELKDLLKEIL